MNWNFYYTNIDEILRNHEPILDNFQQFEVEGINLNYSYQYDIKKACVIQGPESKICEKSVENLGLSVVPIYSWNFLDTVPVSLAQYNNLKISNVRPPEQYKTHSWFKNLKLISHSLNYREVTRILNHATAWQFSIETGEPVIILEHDSQLLSYPKDHFPRGSIIGLGGNVWNDHNFNIRCLGSPWAYSVDPFVAQALMTQLMTIGLRDPLELLFRNDLYTIVQPDKIQARRISQWLSSAF
jgi:hypothetical protein